MANETPDIMTVEDAAEFLHLSIEHVRRLCRQRKLPCRKVGRQWRFSRRQLVAWIESGPVTHQENFDLQ